MVSSVTVWRSKRIATLLFVLSLLWIMRPTGALPTGTQGAAENTTNPPPTETIHITADRMVADNLAHTAEFTGSVRAVQGTFVITSQTLKIYYQTTESSVPNASEDGGSIEKVVASGNVKIVFDDKVATTTTAEYRTATRVLVLTGTDSKIVSAKNSITGAKITFYRADERVIVEGQSGKRVEAEFYPDSQSKGLQ